MSNMKRRIVYFSDDQWRDLAVLAAQQGLTVSAYLRLAADPAGVRWGPVATIHTEQVDVVRPVLPIEEAPAVVLPVQPSRVQPRLDLDNSTAARFGVSKPAPKPGKRKG